MIFFNLFLLKATNESQTLPPFIVRISNSQMQNDNETDQIRLEIVCKIEEGKKTVTNIKIDKNSQLQLRSGQSTQRLICE